MVLLPVKFPFPGLSCEIHLWAGAGLVGSVASNTIKLARRAEATQGVGSAVWQGSSLVLRCPEQHPRSAGYLVTASQLPVFRPSWWGGSGRAAHTFDSWEGGWEGRERRWAEGERDRDIEHSTLSPFPLIP